MTVSYQVVYWRDIPAQVKVRAGRERRARALGERFQQAIDEVAMRTGATKSDDYLCARPRQPSGCGPMFLGW